MNELFLTPIFIERFLYSLEEELSDELTLLDLALQFRNMAELYIKAVDEFFLHSG